MTIAIRRTASRILGFLFAVIFLAMCFMGNASSEVVVKSAPLVTATSATNGMVRVYLSSLGNPSTLNITAEGSYSINGNTSQALSNGEKVTVNFSSTTGRLTITRNGVTTDMGTQFALRRHSVSGTSGLLIAESNMASNPYPGDLRFVVDTVSGGYKLYTIAYIYIESYLYGVLPYEMGNSAPIEALKAQALAARTYTLRAMESRTGSIYDVVDTTSDQVYRGTPSGNANCKAAIDATKGIVLMNGSSLTGTFYTASNGGQTESSKNIWGGSGYSYLNVKDDPFDLANPDSVKKSATVYSDGLSGSQNASLKTLLNAKAASAVKAMGYDGSASVVAVTKITDITPHTPKYADPSRLYTKMDFSLTVRTKNSAGSTVEVAATVTCDIFGDLESMLGMSISSSQNELWTVTKSGSDFILAARRYGHGVGLSQRGAMQMGRMGYTYDQIVGFYFEGCKRVQKNFTNTILSAIVSGQDSTEETIVEEAADIDGGGAPATAIVELVSSSDLLGIRKEASASAAILGSVPHGVPVQVWAVKDGWAFIQYGSILGYVQSSALSISGDAPETTDKTATAISEYAVVTASNYLNLRAKGEAGATILGTAPAGAVLSVFSKTSQWAYIQYGAIIAYASTDFLSFSATYPGTTADPESDGAVVTLADGTGTVNFRASASTGSAVLARLANGTQVTVLRNDSVWCKVQYQGTTGYILAEFLTMTGEPGDTSNEDPQLGDGEVEAIVNSNASTLNLRASASTDAAILLEMPKGESVIVTQKGDTWCAVRYEGVSGYAMTQYLLFGTEEEDGGDTDTAAEYAKVTTASGSLNMRTQGKSGSTILCTIPQNAYVEVVSQGATWTRVRYAGYDGFVMTIFLTFLSPGQTPAPTDTPAPTPTPVPADLQAVVTTVSGSLNMRKSASSGGAIITTIPQNATVTVVSRGSEWTKAEYAGKTGYVMSKFLTFLADATPTPTPTPTPPPEEETETPTPTPTPTATPTATPTVGEQVVYVNTQSGSLNLRSAAKPGATILLRIPQYATVTLLSKGDTWSKITYGGKTGYVMTMYLGFTYATPTPSPSPTPTPTATAAPDSATATPDMSDYAYVNTQSGSLNMRSAAKSSATVLIRIPQYAKVTLLDMGGTWCKVSYGGKTGYVMTTYLSFTAPTPTPTPAATATPTATAAPTSTPTAKPAATAWVNTKSGSLNLRKSAVSGSDVLLAIPQYSYVTLLEKGAAWCKVSYGGSTGYVQTAYLAFEGSPPSSTGETQTAWVLTDSGSLNLRAAASSTAAKVTTIPRLAEVTVYSKGSTWSQVKYNGVTGYVMTAFLTFTKPAEFDTSGSDTQGEDGDASDSPVLDPTLTAVEDMTAQINPENATLNLRTECSTSAAVLFEMPKGETVPVLEKGETWCKVVYNDQEGYCMTQYLIFPTPAES